MRLVLYPTAPQAMKHGVQSSLRVVERLIYRFTIIIVVVVASS